MTVKFKHTLKNKELTDYMPEEDSDNPKNSQEKQGKGSKVSKEEESS